MSSNRRRAVFALLAFAVLGIAPVAGLFYSDRQAAQAALADPELGASVDPSPSSTVPGSGSAAPVVVVTTAQGWARYLDLAIRILALVLAWLMERRENGESARAARRPGVR